MQTENASQTTSTNTVHPMTIAAVTTALVVVTVMAIVSRHSPSTAELPIKTLALEVRANDVQLYVRTVGRERFEGVVRNLAPNSLPELPAPSALDAKRRYEFALMQSGALLWWVQETTTFNAQGEESTIDRQYSGPEAVEYAQHQPLARDSLAFAMRSRIRGTDATALWIRGAYVPMWKDSIDTLAASTNAAATGGMLSALLKQGTSSWNPQGIAAPWLSSGTVLTLDDARPLEHIDMAMQAIQASSKDLGHGVKGIALQLIQSQLGSNIALEDIRPLLVSSVRVALWEGGKWVLEGQTTNVNALRIIVDSATANVPHAAIRTLDLAKGRTRTDVGLVSDAPSPSRSTVKGWSMSTFVSTGSTSFTYAQNGTKYILASDASVIEHYLQNERHKVSGLRAGGTLGTLNAEWLQKNGVFLRGLTPSNLLGLTALLPRNGQLGWSIGSRGREVVLDWKQVKN